MCNELDFFLYRNDWAFPREDEGKGMDMRAGSVEPDK